jgi:hypothetical protein
LFGYLGESAIAIIVEQTIGSLPLEETAEIVGHEQVEQAVAIVIDPGWREPRSPDVSQPRLPGYIGERSVSVIRTNCPSPT